jgi:hypothetical protein
MISTETKSKKAFKKSRRAIRALHAAHRPQLINQLLQKSKSMLINDFFIEMDAKNQAYYFILEFGHFDAFKNYCQKQKTK